MFSVAALIPLMVGAIWYNPKVFGTIWMRVNGFTEESLKGGNMAVIFLLSYIFGVFMAFALSGLVIHQGSAFQMMLPEVGVSGSEAQNQFNQLMRQ